MKSSRTKRNLVTMLIGTLIITPIAIYNANNNKGIFFFVNGIQHGDGFNITPNTERVIANKAVTQISSLTGDWLFATGDDLNRAKEDYPDKDWKKISVPSNWENEGYKDYDGFAWYRREFSVDEKYLTRTLYLSLGRIDDADELYVNGKKVGGYGQLPPTYVSAWSEQRHYAIPENLIRKGANTLALRVYDAREGGGIADGDIGLYATTMPRPLIDLEGEWQFKIDESSTEYRHVDVPKKWEDQGYPNHDGLAWYKKSFGRLAVKPDDTLVLLLGKIDDTDEAYINGHLIGRTGTLDPSDRLADDSYYLIERRYEFPAALLNETNVLEVRVHDSIGDGGIYDGPVAIINKRDDLDY